MDTRQALAELGVTDNTLTKTEKQSLDEDGYVLLFDILIRQQIDAIATRMDDILNNEEERAKVVPTDGSTKEVFRDLVNMGEVFDIAYTHPRVLAAHAHVLEYDMRLSDLNGRFAGHGEGHQGLHTDWGRLETPGVFQACNSGWLLDDFTEDNGATRIVPGSHLQGSKTGPEVMDPNAVFRDEVLILAPAGSVVVFNCHVLHSGTLNRTNRRRRAFHSSFRRRAQSQKFDNRKNLLPETRARLSPAALYLLDA